MDNIYLLLSTLAALIYWFVLAFCAWRIALVRRPYGINITWLMLIFLVPLLGAILYLLFGELNIGHRRANRVESIYQTYKQWFLQNAYQQRLAEPFIAAPHQRPIHELCINQLSIPATNNNQLELISDTDRILNAICEDIKLAKRSIVMEFYIWQPGGMADNVADALLIAKQRGVDIHLLLDAAGSTGFFLSAWHRKFVHAGIQVKSAFRMSPWRLFLRRLDLRQHRKIVVIDSKVAYTGSMNLVDPKIFKQDAGVGQWIDLMVRVSGPTVLQLEAILSWDWELENGQPLLPNIHTNDIAINSQQIDPIQVIPSGPGLPFQVMQQVILLNIYHAKQSITLTSPYFVPSEQLLEALKIAALRGVKIKLIIPAKNDSLLVSWACRVFFDELLSSGVKIFLFNGGLLHTKSILIDDDHCMLGTVNLDIRSLQLNSEVALNIDSNAFCAELKVLLDSYLADSTELSLGNWRARPLHERIVEQGFYLFAPLL